ncbi:hypothetical protein TNIN_201101 [Trichonephila inaurata madagascariensis]|uniref:Uncharacterized protein n=1 Tax=Trichonephila inaurata madagascariensis TaxID=2747483 RepID=A0A8X6IJB2_9ARAC|nr:hypothetical protein TNIN_201101 [Trichonephila inaurata madagascariensis]
MERLLSSDIDHKNIATEISTPMDGLIIPPQIPSDAFCFVLIEVIFERILLIPNGEPQKNVEANSNFISFPPRH